MARFEELHGKLRGGFFLSSLHGHGDGAFCAERGRGCRLVQFGIRLAEPPELGEALGEYRRSVLPFGRTECSAHLAEECQKARSQGDVLTCLNLASPRLEWALAAAHCFVDAGGDLVELNVHGGYWRYLQLGRLRAMVLPEHQAELVRWVEGLVEAGIPLIVKFDGRQNRGAVLQAVSEMERRDVFGVHVNVRNRRTKRPDFGLAQRIRKKYSGFLLASGYVRSAADARTLFNTGVDMVGIGEPVIDNPAYLAGFVGQFLAEAAEPLRQPQCGA